MAPINPTLKRQFDRCRSINSSRLFGKEKADFDQVSDSFVRRAGMSRTDPHQAQAAPEEDEHNEFLRLLRVLADVCRDPPPNETEELA
jgi:hypothetical protein